MSKIAEQIAIPYFSQLIHVSNRSTTYSEKRIVVEDLIL